MSQNNITIPDIINTSKLLVEHYLHNSINYIEKIPGGQIIIRYIKSSHKNDPIRTILEFCLFVFFIYYFLSSRNEVKKKGYVKLSKAEVDELVEDWEPEPLVLPIDERDQWRLDAIPVVKGMIKSHVHIEGESKELINCCSLNFLDLNENERVKKAAKTVIRNAGVGACGPPNFYGNQDVHIELEERLASFFGTEGCVLYGQDFTTAGSVLPSFLKRGDYVLADLNCNLAIQKALSLTRANIYWFKHNDMEDLEHILQDLQDEVFKFEKPISRKMIVTEGLFSTLGDYPNLKKLIELKERFKFRLFLDETYSAGVLGKTGRGLAELYDVPRSKVDITIGSLANAFNGSGGFCIGDAVMSYHQRIGSLAYCFSASLPPYATKIVSTVLDMIDEDSETKGGSCNMITQLHNKSQLIYDYFNKDRALSKLIDITSVAESSILHIKLKEDVRKTKGFPNFYTGGKSEIDRLNKKGISDKFIAKLNEEELILQSVVDESKRLGVLISRNTYSWGQENNPLVPNLKICVNNGISEEELKTVYKVVSEGLKRALK